MSRGLNCLLFALMGILCVLPRQAEQSAGTQGSYAPSEVPDTPAGLQFQVDELVRVAKIRDHTDWQIALSTFSLPNPGSWFKAHFAQEHLAQLIQDYPKVRDGQLGHMSWVIGQNLDAPNFHIQVAQSEVPAPLSDNGPESSLLFTLHPVSVQNFLLIPIADSGSMPPSWVSSFVYADGHFQVVGGTYPFWSEQLQSPRASPPTGPIANNVSAGRILHKVSPKYPKKARKERVEGVVRLHAIIGKDGTIHELSVISGPALLSDAALQAVRQWRYEPTLLNGEPVEVDTTIDVIFALNQ